MAGHDHDPEPPGDALNSGDLGAEEFDVYEGTLQRNLACPRSLMIKGDIGQGVEVSVTGRLKVIGWVDPGAVVVATGHTEIIGGVKSATVEVDGNLYAESIVDSRIRAAGACNVLLGIRDSDVSIVGSLEVTDGGITGGTTVVTDRIMVQTIGEPALLARSSERRSISQQVRTTLIRISLTSVRDVAVRDLDARIQRVEEDLDKLESFWLPVLDDPDMRGSLTPAEQAELDDKRRLITQSRKLLGRLEGDRELIESRLQRRMSAAPKVMVGRRVFPGTDVRIWSNIVRFDEEVSGPIEITPSFSLSQRRLRIDPNVDEPQEPKPPPDALPAD